MAKSLGLLVALLGLAAGTASAQDARSVVRAAATAMGATNLTSIRYSGSGWIAAPGQSFSLADDWPRWEVPSYSRLIDYNGRAYREEYVRRQGTYPPRGGGGTPLAGEQRIVQMLNGTYAWNVNGDTPVPQPGLYMAGIPVSDLRQLEIVLTPHGFLKGAMAASDAALTSVTLPFAGPTNEGMTGSGRKATILSYVALGKYRVNGTVNDQNLVELVTTWIPNPVYGDMLYEVRHLDYRDFGPVKFPTTIHVHQGDPVFNPAHNFMEIRVASVQANVTIPPMTVPDPVRSAIAPPVRAESQQVAAGVWVVGGGSHNSVAIEFADFVAVVEAPLNEARSIAVIDEVTRLVPAKPIRYVINTHHHFDHAGGLRTYLAQGATIVTAQSNRDFYQDVMFAPLPRTLQPDRLSLFYPNFTGSRRPAPFETVNTKYVISDGTRTLDLHPVQGLNHAAGMLVAHLPKERILINGDLYSPPSPGATPPPSASSIALRNNIERLTLDVAQHVPIHGRAGTHEEFLSATARPVVVSRAERLEKERDNVALQQVPPFKAFDNVSYVGVGWVGAWLVSTTEGLILLDAVEERYVDHLLTSVKRLGFDPAQIKYVVITQAHADHYGGAAKIQETYGARVAMGEADWEAIAQPSEGSRVRPPARDVVLEDGDTIKLGSTTLRFHATPGHTPGTMSVDFTVFDRGQPHRAFLLGGGAPAPGAAAAEQFLASLAKVERLQSGVQVRLVNHPWMDPQFWDRAEKIVQRGPSDPHPMVAPEAFRAWIQELKATAVGSRQ